MTPPNPYTIAVASDAITVNETNSTVRFIAIVTPMSRTRPARTAYSSSSRLGSPKSLTSKAPPTLNRSVIREPSSALTPICSCARVASRRPNHRAGRRKRGTSASAPRVSCQDSDPIAPMMSVNETALLTTLESTLVNACCAPMTSLLRRLTRAPVWARVKKAIGWRSTWLKTSVRRWKIRPSPMRAEYHREAMVTTALKRASPATMRASRTTTSRLPGTTPSSTRRASRSGVATNSMASTTTSARNAVMILRNGRA